MGRKLHFKIPMPKKPPQILFCKYTYKMPVRDDNWTYAVIAEKKDNDVYRDGLSNALSTYTRFGTNDQGFMTETRHMLAQVHDKTDLIYSFKPLVNFTSYPCTDTPGRNKLMKRANLAQLSPDYGTMDYMTTQQDDYRNPYPSVIKPLTMPRTEWLMNRVIRSDLTQNGGTAPPRGDYQYLDAHTPIGHIRQIRLHRAKSFDPATGLQSFPTLAKSLDPKENH